MMTCRIGFKTVIFLCCLLLTGCPVTLNVKVTNEAKSEIAILYSTGFESKIKPGKTKKEIYKFDCIKVKTEGQLYEYQPVRPPNKYVETGMFSSLIYAVFTDEKDFKIYIKGDGASENIVLEKGCDSQ